MPTDPLSIAKGAIQANSEPPQSDPTEGFQESQLSELSMSRQLLDEVKSRKFERDTQSQPSTPAPSGDSELKKELEDMRTRFEVLSKQLDKRDSGDPALRQLAERQTGLMEILARSSQQAAYKPEPLPEIPQFEDPELMAAFNAMEQRMSRQTQEQINQLRHQQMQGTRQLYQRDLENTLRKYNNDAEFSKHFTADHWRKFAEPFINRGDAIDWDHEISLALYAKQGPDLAKENKALKAELEQLRKGNSRQREKQKENLSLVSPLGSRAGSSGQRTGTNVAEQILNEARGRGKKISFNEFGREFMKRRSG